MEAPYTFGHHWTRDQIRRRPRRPGRAGAVDSDDDLSTLLDALAAAGDALKDCRRDDRRAPIKLRDQIAEQAARRT
jgi:hypothetical protein